MSDPVGPDEESATIRRSDLHGRASDSEATSTRRGRSRSRSSTPPTSPTPPASAPAVDDDQSTVSRSSLKVRPAQNQPGRQRSSGATATGGSRWRSILGLRQPEDTQAVHRNEPRTGGAIGVSSRST